MRKININENDVYRYYVHLHRDDESRDESHDDVYHDGRDCDGRVSDDDVRVSL